MCIMAQIPVRISPRNHINRRNRRCARNLITVKTSKPGPPISKAVPKGLIRNARLLVKPDAPSALNTELSSNNIDVCFVSETWLNSNISSNLVCRNGYNILRNDRTDFRKGGGVAILYRNDKKILNVYPSENFKCLWCEIQKDNAKYFVAVLYHPPNPNYPECELLEYLSDKCEEILFLDSLATIIAGDINQLPVNDFCTQHNLQQLVSKASRGQRILDVFITNCPYLWKSPSAFKGLVSPCLHVSGFVCIRRHFVAVTKLFASTRIRTCCVFNRPHVSESDPNSILECLNRLLSMR